MKKNYLILSILICCFLFMKSFSYQPAESGLLFSGKFKAGKSSTKNDQTNRHVIHLGFEKQANGAESTVVRINNLSEFLALSLNKVKPVFVRVFSDEKQYRELFQQVANKFNDKAFFVSLDSSKNESLVQVFLAVLKAKGINFPGGVDSYPMFLFCNKDFVVLQNDSVAFQKDSLKLLAVRYLDGFEAFSGMVQKVFSMEKVTSTILVQNQPKNCENAEKAEISKKVNKKAGFWELLKKYFK